MILNVLSGMDGSIGGRYAGCPLSDPVAAKTRNRVNDREKV
jgi:hypothetical protein